MKDLTAIILLIAMLLFVALAIITEVRRDKMPVKSYNLFPVEVGFKTLFAETIEGKYYFNVFINVTNKERLQEVTTK